MEREGKLLAKELALVVNNFDGSSARGLACDLKTLSGLGVYASAVCSGVMAADTSRCELVSPVGAKAFAAQLSTLAADSKVASLKIGYIDSVEQVEELVSFISAEKPRFVIYDPVLGESQTALSLSDNPLFRAIKEKLMPLCHMMTVSLTKSGYFLGEQAGQIPALDDRSALDQYIEELGMKLVVAGPRSVLLTGGGRKGSFSQDYFTNGVSGLWLSSLRRTTRETLGKSDTLASALAGAVCLGHNIMDGLVIARSYLNQSLDSLLAPGKGAQVMSHGQWQCDQSTLPWLTLTGEEGRQRMAFRPTSNLGFYPIVDSFAMVERLVTAGVKHIQLRIKNLSGEALSLEIRDAARLCRQMGCELFINDYVDLAIEYGASGVHLGQADLVSHDLTRLSDSGLKLGVTARAYWEVARALAFKPSYITVGPVFDDETHKEAHEGLTALVRWRKVLDFPIVAAGGISLENATAVLATGVDSIAVYRDLSAGHDLSIRLEKWLRLFEKRGLPSGIDRSFDASVTPSTEEAPRIASSESTGEKANLDLYR